MRAYYEVSVFNEETRKDEIYIEDNFFDAVELFERQKINLPFPQSINQESRNDIVNAYCGQYQITLTKKFK